MTSTHSGCPSSKLISRIHHLQCLLENLPSTLPLDPVESTYHFGLDSEDIEEEDMWFTFNRNFEVCFETHKLTKGQTIAFRECGDQCMALIKTIKGAMKVLTTEQDCTLLRQVWIEQLIEAAKLQEAKALPKCIIH